MPVSSLAELDNLNLVRDFCRAGLRVSITRSLTNTGTRVSRAFWKEIHGKSPSTGKLPESSLSFVRSRADAARLSSFASFYTTRHGASLDAAKLFDAWQAFVAATGDFNINAAFFVIRDIKAGLIVLSHCPGCRQDFVFEFSHAHASVCPFCSKRK